MISSFTVRIEKAGVIPIPRNLNDIPVLCASGCRAARCDLHGAYFGVAECSLFVLLRSRRSSGGRELLGE